MCCGTPHPARFSTSSSDMPSISVRRGGHTVEAVCVDGSAGAICGTAVDEAGASACARAMVSTRASVWLASHGIDW
jgi:hypothetical protein